MTTTTKTTVESAPRDLEALKKQGRFNLRMLAEALGVFTAGEAAKTSFMSMDNDAQATTVFNLLKDYDKKNGGGGKEEAEPPARQPSNKGAKAGAKNGAAATPPPQANASGGGDAKVGDGAAKILAAVLEQNKLLASVLEGLDELKSRLSTVEELGERNTRFTTISVGLSLKLAEEVLRAGPDQVIPAVIDDLPLVERHLAAVAGISEEGGEEEEEEGEEDPNE